MIFIVVFVVCSYFGLVNEGLNLFYKMRDEYGVEFIFDYYVCVVDLFGRVGRLEVVYEFINNMFV